MLSFDSCQDPVQLIKSNKIDKDGNFTPPFSYINHCIYKQDLSFFSNPDKTDLHVIEDILPIIIPDVADELEILLGKEDLTKYPEIKRIFINGSENFFQETFDGFYVLFQNFAIFPSIVEVILYNCSITFLEKAEKLRPNKYIKTITLISCVFQSNSQMIDFFRSFINLETVYLDSTFSNCIDFLKSNFPKINFIETDENAFTLIINNLEEVKEDIYALNMNNVNENYDLHEYVNVRFLSLQHNQIYNITDIIGLEKLKHLVFLNLSKNLIKKFEMPSLKDFQELAVIDISRNRLTNVDDLGDLKLSKSLKHLYVFNQRNRKFTWNDVVDYLKDTNIETIDGIPVNFREKWFAKKHNSNFNSDEFYVSHLNHLMEKVDTVANLGFKQLISADFSLFNRIEKLNLRNNALKSLTGIECLTKLTYIDVSGNPDLNYKNVLAQLSNLKNLHEVFLAIDCWSFSAEEIAGKSRNDFFDPNAPIYYVRNIKYRRSVLRKLSACLRLHTLDRIPILAEELQLEETPKKFSDIIQLIHSTYLTDIDIDRVPENTKDLMNYVAENAECINWYPFINSIPNISILKNLQILDLGNCQLKTIEGIGISECKQLHYINLSRNQINDNLRTIAGELRELPNLVELYISDNPFVNVPHRKNIPQDIVGLLSNYDICRLLLITVLKNCEVIDTEITDIDERMAEYIIDKDSQISLFSLFETPEMSKIFSVNIGSFGLTELPLSIQYSKVLIANGNLFTETTNLDLKYIKYLDLSRNHYSNLQYLAYIATKLNVQHFICLEQLDENNNLIQFNRKKFLKYYFRYKIIKREASPVEMLKEAYQNVPLKAVDNESISLEEVLDVFGVDIDDLSEKDITWLLPKIVSQTIYLSSSQSKSIYRIKSEFTPFLQSNLSKCLVNKLVDRKVWDEVRYTTPKRVYLSSNSLTSDDIVKLKFMRSVEYIDISDNQIENPEAVAEFIARYSELKHLVCDRNPFCPNKEDFHSLLDLLKRGNAGIETINGIPVSLQSKFDENFDWYLSQRKVVPHMDFSYNNIKDLKALENFKPENYKIINSFDLSHNQLRDLPPESLMIFDIETLDISYNKIESIDMIIDFLEYYPMIKDIKVDHATDTDEDFFEIIQEKCPFIQTIDGRPTSNTNVYIYGGILTSIRKIYDFLFHPFKIDMSGYNKPLDSNELQFIINTISPMGIVEFTMPPCAFAFPDAENIFILNLMKTLKKINGAELDQGRIMQAVKCKRKSFTDDVPKSLDRKIEILALLKNQDPEELVEKFESLGEKAKVVSSYALKFGSFISKTEIFITFQQILMQIINLIEKIHWPQIYLNLSWLAWIFAIDWSFLNFIFDIRIPTFLSTISYFFFTIIPILCIIVYYWSSFERVEHMITFNTPKEKRRANALSIFALFMGFVFSWGIGFIFDFNAVIYYKKMTNNWLGWSLAFSLVSILLFIGWKTFLWYTNEKIGAYRKIVISKWMKKVALWMLLLVYSPTVQYFVDILTCDENYEYSAGFDTLVCWKDSHTFTFVHLITLIICIIYALAIPIFCIVEIRNGIKSLDEFKHFGVRLEQLEIEKENIKKVKKGEIDDPGLLNDEYTNKELIKDLEETYKKNSEEFEKEYIAASNDFEHPSVYLFNQFKRKDRYKKVFDLLKKVVTMGLTAFMTSAIAKNLIASVMYLGLSIYQVIERPLTVFCEDVLESLAQVCNLGSLAVGEFLRFEWINTPIFTDIIAPFILIALVCVIIIAFLVMVIMYHTCCGKSKKINSDAEEEEEEEEEDKEEIDISNSDLMDEFYDLLEENPEDI